MSRRRNGTGRPRTLVLVLAVAGCGGNVTVSRGFASREVLPLRDPTVALAYVTDVEGQDPTLIYSSQSKDAGASTSWSLNLATGAVHDVGLDPPSSGTTPGAIAPYICSTNDLLSDGTATVEVTETATGAKFDINGVAAFNGCVRDDGTFSVFRRDSATGHLVLWAGPFDELVPVALPFDVLRVAFYRADAAGQPSTSVVVGAAPTQSSAAGIYTIDLVANTATEVVPPTPASVAWASGAPQAGSLEPAGVAPDVDIFPFHGHYLYCRLMSDGGTVQFAGPFSSGPASELALFQASASGTSNVSSIVQISPSDDVVGPRVFPQMIGWQVDGVGGAARQLVVWDETGSQVTVCPSAPDALQTGVLSQDGSHVLFRAFQLGAQLTTAPLQLMTLAAGQPGTCVALQNDNVLWADFSGDGSTIAWLLVTGPGLASQLWISNSDGSDPKMVLSGQLFAAGFVRGTTHLELSYAGDLVWLDVRDPSHFSYVAERLFGYATAIGGSWFVAGYDDSTQDASGTLGVVNLDSGKKLPISPAVAQFVVSTQVTVVDGGTPFDGVATGVYHVVYLVRGRNPSSQDGIWVATVRAADLQ
jgi:hypothetical protein